MTELRILPCGHSSTWLTQDGKTCGHANCKHLAPAPEGETQIERIHRILEDTVNRNRNGLYRTTLAKQFTESFINAVQTALTKQHKACPECLSLIPGEAKRCRFCQANVPPAHHDVYGIAEAAAEYLAHIGFPFSHLAETLLPAAERNMDRLCTVAPVWKVQRDLEIKTQIEEAARAVRAHQAAIEERKKRTIAAAAAIEERIRRDRLAAEMQRAAEAAVPVTSAERERAVEYTKAQYAAGTLDNEIFETRLGQILSAATRGELGAACPGVRNCTALADNAILRTPRVSLCHGGNSLTDPLPLLKWSSYPLIAIALICYYPFLTVLWLGWAILLVAASLTSRGKEIDTTAALNWGPAFTLLWPPFK